MQQLRRTGQEARTHRVVTVGAERALGAAALQEEETVLLALLLAKAGDLGLQEWEAGVGGQRRWEVQCRLDREDGAWHGRRTGSCLKGHKLPLPQDPRRKNWQSTKLRVSMGCGAPLACRQTKPATCGPVMAGNSTLLCSLLLPLPAFVPSSKPC